MRYSYCPTDVCAHREGVGKVPAELLCEEVVDPRPVHDLGQLGRVAKCVRQPELHSVEKNMCC